MYFVVSGTEADSVDHTVDLMVDFITLLSSKSSPSSVRGPFLAQLELKKRLKERGDERWQIVFGLQLKLFKC